MKIQAAVAYTTQEQLSIEQVELAAPNPDEILVKIAGVGICHTDILMHQVAGAVFQNPVVFGHEGAGTVAAIGSDVTKVSVGDRVAITFRSCGDCNNCDAGPAAYCEHFPALNYSGVRTDGSRPLMSANGALDGNFFGQSSFATHCLTYERNVVKVPDGVPLELAGPLGCGIQTGAGAVLNSLDVKPGSSLVVAGGGPVGLSAVMAGKLRGCSKIILIEPQPSRRAFALAHGAHHAIDPGATDDIAQAIRAIVPKGVDDALDTTGIADVIEGLMASIRINGKLGLVGLSGSDAHIPLKINFMTSQAISILGIIEGDSDPDIFLPYLMAQYMAGSLPFDEMITTYPLRDINHAIADQKQGKCIKAVLLPHGD